MWVPLHCFNVYIIFLYMTIFKVYLLDFYPRVVETCHPYPQNPYPCAWVVGYGFLQVRVWVQLEIPRGYPCHSLDVSDLSKLAAHNYEDILQCIIPCIEGLLPYPHNETILGLDTGAPVGYPDLYSQVFSFQNSYPHLWKIFPTDHLDLWVKNLQVTGTTQVIS